MIRKIIHIDKEKCSGCGLCAEACREGAIGMIDGKAALLRDDYCDGLGDCLPVCPAGAITFVEREAAAYNKMAVPLLHRCPGTQSGKIRRSSDRTASAPRADSELSQWPVQIKLAPVNAPYFNGSHLLIAADCTAYACKNFHHDFMKGRITLIGCPKLDDTEYSKKLSEIIGHNDIKSITCVRMEVPCCRGIEEAVRQAVASSGKSVPWKVAVISTDGNILPA